MLSIRRFTLLLAGTLLPLCAIAKAGAADVAESDPGLFMMMMVILLVFLGAVAIGVIVLICLAVIAGALIAAGLASVATLVAWYHRSVTKGLKVLVYLSFSGIGAAGGLLAAWLIQYNKQLQFSSTPLVFFISILSGICGGLLVARLFLYGMKVLFRRIDKKTNNRSVA